MIMYHLGPQLGVWIMQVSTFSSVLINRFHCIHTCPSIHVDCSIREYCQTLPIKLVIFHAFSSLPISGIIGRSLIRMCICYHRMFALLIKYLSRHSYVYFSVGVDVPNKY